MCKSKKNDAKLIIWHCIRLKKQSFFEEEKRGARNLNHVRACALQSHISCRQNPCTKWTEAQKKHWKITYTADIDLWCIYKGNENLNLKYSL